MDTRPTVAVIGLGELSSTCEAKVLAIDQEGRPRGLGRRQESLAGRVRRNRV